MENLKGWFQVNCVPPYTVAPGHIYTLCTGLMLIMGLALMSPSDR